MRVHYVERHLDRIESEAVVRRHLQHIQMDPWVLVPRETDIAEFSRFPSLHEGGIGPFVIKDPVRVFVPELCLLGKRISVKLRPMSYPPSNVQPVSFAAGVAPADFANEHATGRRVIVPWCDQSGITSNTTSIPMVSASIKKSAPFPLL